MQPEYHSMYLVNASKADRTYRFSVLMIAVVFLILLRDFSLPLRYSVQAILDEVHVVICPKWVSVTIMLEG